MPRISDEKRKQVVRLWLLGTTRAEINGITSVSSGEVSNIIADYKKRLDETDPEAIKDLYRILSEENIAPSQCAVGFRILRMIIGMGGNEEKIGAFLSNIEKECVDKEVPTSAIVPSLQAAIEFSEKEGVPISEVPSQIERRGTELANLQAEIEVVKADKNKAIEDAKMTKDFVKEYIEFKDRLNVVGLTTEDADAAINLVSNMKSLGSDPKQIAAQFSKIKSLESAEKRHELRCTKWEGKVKFYKGIGQLAEWFVSNGYTRIQLEMLQDIINDVAMREGITPAQARGRFFAAVYAFEYRDELERRVKMLSGVAPILEKERDDLINYLPDYRYAVEKIAALAYRFGSTVTKEVVDTMIEILTSDYYRSDPQMLIWALEKVRQRRKEQLLQREQQQKYDEVSKLKDQNDGRPSAAAPALAEPILKPERDLPDQCRNEEGNGAAGGSNNQEGTSYEQEQHDNQENDGNKSTA